jgi:4-amino-4-deoxy-L-arabinose transferase-like glycosyltransferase
MIGDLGHHGIADQARPERTGAAGPEHLMAAVTTQPAHPGPAAAPEGPAARGRLARLLRGSENDPRWARPALIALLALTALLYMAGLSRNGWANDFYAAAVQAGSKSWKAFFFGSFDSSNFITVDKTPAFLWVMDVSARIFGLSYWSVLVPQALEGVATVAALYATVRRWFGPAAGILAGAVMALTPVAALMFRYNNPDALLTLLMTVAAYALTRAIEAGKTRWLVLAGALLGFGFLAKMLQAFLVLPGFGVAYLVAGPRGLGRRLLQLLAGGAAVLLAAGWWVAIVLLTPAADRPYVGGSTNNNILELTFGYNGFGRLDGSETGSVGFGGRGVAATGGSTGIARLFAADMGGQISWLLPAALIALAALLWGTRRAPRTDRIRAAALVWGGWLLVTGLVFSYMAGIIHSYYTVALAPAIGALVGIGAVQLWRVRNGWRGHERSWFGRGMLAAGIVITAVWSYALLDRTPAWYPWLRVVILLAGLGAAAAVIAGYWLASIAATAWGRAALIVAPVSLALIAALAGPLAYSLNSVATPHTGALPTAGPAVTAFGGPGGGGGPGGFARHGGSGPGGFRHGGSGPGGGFGGATGRGSAGTGTGFGGTGSSPGGRSGPGGIRGRFHGGFGGGRGGGGGGGLGGNTQVSSAFATLLKDGASGYRWVAATVSSDSAAPLQLASGKPIMSIGGFNGTDPAPTLAQFKKYVADHEIHYFVGANSDSFGGGSGDAAQITAWVQAHFRAETVGGETVYNLAG